MVCLSFSMVVLFSFVCLAILLCVVSVAWMVFLVCFVLSLYALCIRRRCSRAVWHTCVFAVHINQARGHYDDLGVLASAQVGTQINMRIPMHMHACKDKDPYTYMYIQRIVYACNLRICDHSSLLVGIKHIRWLFLPCTRYWNGQYLICVSPDLLKQYLKQQKKGRIIMNVEKLHWAPLEASHQFALWLLKVTHALSLLRARMSNLDIHLYW